MFSCFKTATVSLMNLVTKEHCIRQNRIFVHLTMPIEIFEIDTLPGYVAYLKKRTLMLLCREEIDLLEANLNGYLMTKAAEMEWFSGFNDFLFRTYPAEEGNRGWRSFLLEMNHQDQKQALADFFVQFEAYCAAHPR